MTGHIHQKPMLQYAEDAATTDKPWELWEGSYEGELWVGLEAHPRWLLDRVYRRKIKTNLIHGVEIPALPYALSVGGLVLLREHRSARIV